MEKVKKWINKNKGLCLLLVLTLILLIFITVIFVRLFVGGQSDKYGNRLDGIEDVQISDDTMNGVKDEIMGTSLVEEARVRIQGKIVYTTIVLKSDTSVDKAKEIASNTLDNYTEDEIAFYDFSYFLKWEKEEGDTVLTGNKHPLVDEIKWVNS